MEEMMIAESLFDVFPSSNVISMTLFELVACVRGFKSGQWASQNRFASF